MTRYLLLSLVCTAAISPFAMAQSSKNKPIEIKDVPRETQIGPGKPAAGARYVPAVPAKSSLPTLWLIGDSTVRNGSTGESGPDGQWGWGAPITSFFELKKINLVNRALGGTSSRTFYNSNWKDMKGLVKKGDFVMMQFGANDDGKANGKGGLNGIGEETAQNNEETVHTYGWYLRQFVAEIRAAGATPIICSLTPRKGWSEDGKEFKGGGAHAGWAEQIAKETNTAFVPLNTLIGKKYQELGQEKVDTLFPPNEKLHTGWTGAVVNAECVVSGLKGLSPNPLSAYLSSRADSIAPGTK